MGFFFFLIDIQVFQHHLLKTVVPALNCFHSFVKSQLALFVQGYFWTILFC